MRTRLEQSTPLGRPVPAFGGNRRDIGKGLFQRIGNSGIGGKMVGGDPDAAGGHRARAADQPRLLADQHLQSRPGGVQGRYHAGAARTENEDIIVLFKYRHSALRKTMAATAFRSSNSIVSIKYGFETLMQANLYKVGSAA